MCEFLSNNNNNDGGSPFTSWEIHYNWLVNEDGDNRGKLSCCYDAEPFCQWCIIDMIIDRNITRLKRKWKKNRKNRIHKLRYREVSGKWKVKQISNSGEIYKEY